MMARLLNDGIRKRPHQCPGDIFAQPARRHADLVKKRNHVRSSYLLIVSRSPGAGGHAPFAIETTRIHKRGVQAAQLDDCYQADAGSDRRSSMLSMRG